MPTPHAKMSQDPRTGLQAQRSRCNVPRASLRFLWLVTKTIGFLGTSAGSNGLMSRSSGAPKDFIITRSLHFQSQHVEDFLTIALC